MDGVHIGGKCIWGDLRCASSGWSIKPTFPLVKVVLAVIMEVIHFVVDREVEGAACGVRRFVFKGGVTITAANTTATLTIN